MIEDASPGAPAARRMLSALPWIVGFGLGTIPVFLGLLNHDVAWLLHAADRVRSGGRLYVDILEINPPLIVWLNFPPVLTARMLGISEILSFRVLMLGVLACSFLMSRWTLAREDPDRPAVRRPVLILTMLALLPLPGYDFGQREHLMLGLFLPYILLASARAKGRPMGRDLPWIVGLMAGVGIAIKPHFALIWIGIEGYVAWARRGRHDHFRPEAVAVVAVGLTYLAAVFLLAPEYVGVVAWATHLYTVCGRATLANLINQPATMFTAIALLGFLVVRPRGEHRERCRILLIANLGFLAIVFIQGKGFTYHFYPVMATAMMLVGLLPMGRLASDAAPPKYSRAMMQGTLAVMLAYMSAALVAESMIWKGRPDASDTTVGRMIRLVREGGHDEGMFTFSPAVAASFPLVLYGGQRWTSPQSCHWFLTSLYPTGMRPGEAREARTASKMGPTERFLLKSVVDDLVAARPGLLFVDEAENKPAFRDGPFDFLAYYSIDPRFPGFLRDYERFSRVDNFGVYRRKVRSIGPMARARDDRGIPAGMADSPGR